MWSLWWNRRSDSSLEEKYKALSREFAQALEQQAATSEILRVIASSPTDLQSVLDVVAEMQPVFATRMMLKFIVSRATW